MNKAEFKEKRKKLLEQRVRPTEGTEAVSAWDYDFNDSNEVLQSGEVELLENMTPIVPEDRPKTSEIFKEKRNKARHKLDAPILSEQLSDYPGSLNARDAVPPMVLMMDDVPDDVQKSTLSDPVSLPTPEPAIKKVSKAQSLVEVAEEAKKHVHIISYGNTLYYYNNYYYTQLDAKQLIKLYRKYVDYELNNESSLRGYKELYGCFMTDPQIECSEPEDEPIYAPLENGIFDLVEWKLYPHSPDQITFTYIKAKYAPEAKCPIFEGYLHQVTGGDPQLMERFWMAIGYLLIYPARGKFFIFMKGVGNSGKSVLGRFIRQLYPKESISSIRLKNLTNQFGMASLATSVINFDMDMPSSRIDDEAASRLKQITGGDSMNIPRKYRDDALLERRIKFVFSSNHPLIIDGEDEALMKRIVYLPFNYAIPDNQQDPDLGDKIWAERDAIVTKALYYARKLVQRNYIFPEIPYVDSAKYSPVKRFVQEICDTSNINAEVALSDLYKAYLDFCKEQNIGACTDSDLRKALIAMGFEHMRSRCSGEGMIAHEHAVSAFRGIRLRP
jgi:putative DNA primase/helicase